MAIIRSGTAMAFAQTNMILDKYQKLSLKNKIVATLISFVLIIFSLIYFIAIPAIKNIQTTGKDIEGQMINLEETYIKTNNLRQLAKNLKEIEPKLDALNQIFIDKNRELEFITTLENEANNNRINQKINLSSPKTTANQEFQKNDLQLSTNGEFNKQLRYLMDLESLNYYINVKSLELSSSPGGGQIAPSVKNNGPETLPLASASNNINLSITADIYWK